MHEEIWVVAECDGGTVRPVTRELLTRASALSRAFGFPVGAVVMGSGFADAALEDLILRGADRVYVADDPRLGPFIVENRSGVLVRLATEMKPSIVIAAATTSGRTLMPHAAVRLGTGLTADCTELDADPGTGDLLQTRPAIGGDIMAVIRTAGVRPQMATVRPHSSPEAGAVPGRKGEILRVPVDIGDFDPRIEWISRTDRTEERAGVEDAGIIVACGRGFRKQAGLKVAEELAAELGASLGASRDAVDRGWMPYPSQIGLSGKTVSPEVYIAAGISGAVQHLAGIKTAGTIVAVNSDPDAPIFRIADFGIVGDLFEVLPRLTRAVRERRLQP